MTGNYVDPKVARTTVSDWCDSWLIGYGTRRKPTVRQASVHVKVIKAHFGSTPLSAVKPSDVKAWTVTLGDRYAPSTTYATYRRFAQVMSDAVHDGIIPKSPCSRRTSPPQAKQRPYVATTQVWALHEAMPAHLRVAILLGAFVGLRVSEAAALRIQDVDYMRGVVKPQIQYPQEPLKSETSMTPVPAPSELALLLSVNRAEYGGATVVTNEVGQPTFLCDRTGDPCSQGTGRGSPGRLSLSRPAALPRVPSDRLRPRRQSGTDQASPRQRDHNAQHRRAPAAGCRRVLTSGRRCGAECS